MTVTPDDIAAELGDPTPVADPTETQWQGWIDRTVRQIERRARRMGVDPEDLDEETVDDVVLLAVARHARNPEGAVSLDTSVDDGREMVKLRHSDGEVTITDLWWSWLFPDAASGAWSTRTAGEPDECADRPPLRGSWA